MKNNFLINAKNAFMKWHVPLISDKYQNAAHVGLPIIAIIVIVVLIICILGGGKHGIAATVNGVAIQEDEITKTIEEYRKTNGYTTDESWGQLLANINQTPETYRESVIRKKAKDIIYEQACEEKGIVIEDDAIDAKVLESKGYYDSQEGYSFDDFLKENMFTEETYREYIKESLMKYQFITTFETTKTSDEDLLSYVNANLASIANAKKLQVIATKDMATAETALSDISSGNDFTKVQAKYSVLSNNSYDGWMKITQKSESIADTVRAMSINDVSNILNTGDGWYYIIKVVDAIEVPDSGYTSAEDIPDSVKERFQQDITSTAAFKASEKRLDELYDNADIHINAMPRGLSYDVDMAGFVSQSGSRSTDITSDDSAVSTNTGTSENQSK